MRRPICIATKGFLSKNTTTIAVRGYLCGDQKTPVIVIPVERKKRFADESDVLPIKTLNLHLEDEEILTILKIFITCQDRVLKN